MKICGSVSSIGFFNDLLNGVLFVITINVKDLDKSILFYESIGLTVKSRWGIHYVQLTAPVVIIGLHPTDEANLPGNSGSPDKLKISKTRCK